MWSQIWHAHFGQKLPNLADFGLFWRFFVHYFGCDHPIHFKYFSSTSPTGSRQLHINYIMWYHICHADFGQKLPNLADFGLFWRFFVHYFGCDHPIHFKYFSNISPTGSRQLCTNYIVRYLIWHAHFGRKWWKWPNLATIFRHFFWPNYSPNFLVT